MSMWLQLVICIAISYVFAAGMVLLAMWQVASSLKKEKVDNKNEHITK